MFLLRDNQFAFRFLFAKIKTNAIM